MGSSTSKPRKGHEHPQHLPKVGTKPQQEWDRTTRINEVFGATWLRVLAIIIVVLAVVGLVLIII